MLRRRSLLLGCITLLLLSAPPLARAELRPPAGHIVPFDVTLVPPVSPFFFWKARTVIGPSVNLVGGSHVSAYGLEVGTIFNHEYANAGGIQIAGVVNLVRGNATGLQLAGILNRVDGRCLGVQLSLLGNRCERGAAIQVAPFMNKGGAGLSGLQVALYNTAGMVPFGVQLGALNNSFGNFTGIQLGLVNLDGQTVPTKIGETHDAGGDYEVYQTVFNDEAVTRGFVFGVWNQAAHFKGIQLGGLANFVSSMHGIQVAGINWSEGEVHGFQLGGLNWAGPLRGVQCCTANFAEEVHGLQVGLINYAGSLRGLQLGGLNIAGGDAFPLTMLVNAKF